MHVISVQKLYRTHQPDTEDFHPDVKLDGPRTMREWPTDAHVPVNTDHAHVHNAGGAAENVRKTVHDTGGEIERPVTCKWKKDVTPNKHSIT